MHSEEFELDSPAIKENADISTNSDTTEKAPETDTAAAATSTSTSTTGSTITKRKLQPCLLSEATTNNVEWSVTQNCKRSKTDNDNHSEMEEPCSSSGFGASHIPQEKEDAVCLAELAEDCSAIVDNAPPAADAAENEIVIKQEQAEADNEAVASSSTGAVALSSRADAPAAGAVQIKQETAETSDEDELPQASDSTGTGTSNPVDVKPAVKVEIADATSSTSSTRNSCKFGIRCYRRNPMHRIEEAHPGDNDYKRPSFPAPPAGTPDCPFGNSCYRRNPIHFQQFNHPADTDFAQNYKNYRMRLRQRQQRQQQPNGNADGSDLDEYDLDDPFIDDAEFDSDYVPSNDENDDDDDGDLAEE